ncbi:thioredoxin domain-containing protein [Anabaena sp. AL09]|uniref:protein kinase domain-containing protein n=1 Tax=Anabaena sp. AL09 TaxID=1710891 RepID=UPI000A7A1D21|nr:thioredoxin domain-containing protein [Anabaena sp. AL09]
MAWVSGQQLQNGKYTIDKELDRGGFGITFLAKDKKGNPVVIKTLLKKPDRDNHNFDKSLQDFINEAIKLAKCSHHPHIVKVYECIKEGDIWGIVMEYIEGEKLEHLGVLPESQALKYIQQIGEALTVVHQNDLLHRDVKPGNILVRNNKAEAVLIDFGISRDFSPNLTQTHTAYHTSFYAPLEQHDRRGKRGAFMDVYGLSATLYKLLTGKEPEDSRDRDDGIRLPEPKEINSNISDRVNKAILKGLELQSENRPQSVQEWLGLLGLNPNNYSFENSTTVIIDNSKPEDESNLQEIINVTNRTFNLEVLNSNIPVLAFFWASWAAPCRMMEPILDEIANEYQGMVKVVKINTDENLSLATQFNIHSVPQMMIFLSGQKVDMVVGAIPKQVLAGILDKYILEKYI